MSKQKNYEIKIINRGEEMIYSDAMGKLTLGRTYIDGHRLYCDNTATLPIERRKQVIDNLCDFFDALHEENIFVLDIRDKDRDSLENYFVDLKARGFKVSVEHDSDEERNKREEEMIEQILRAGKGLSINGIAIHSIEEFRELKRQK